MDEERIRELARDPNHIRGVYNYCDRWCERCEQQSKCLVFTMEQEQKASGQDPLESIRASLEMAQTLLKEKMEEFGLDPEALAVEAEEEPDPFEGIRAHPLVQKAEQYAFGTAAHLEPVQDALVTAAGSFQRKVELGITPNQGFKLEDLEQCRDAVETILHFRFLICSKIFRALSGMAPQEDGRPDPYCAEDARLSAQVASKGMQRSIEAWLILRNAFPGKEAGILEMLLQLDRLRREAEIQFPGSGDPAQEE
jgi:hypothetical protein